MKNALIAHVESKSLKAKPPEFDIGDIVDVHCRIVEGDKERIQVFSGTVKTPHPPHYALHFHKNQISYHYTVFRTRTNVDGSVDFDGKPSHIQSAAPAGGYSPYVANDGYKFIDPKTNDSNALGAIFGARLEITLSSGDILETSPGYDSADIPSALQFQARTRDVFFNPEEMPGGNIFEPLTRSQMWKAFNLHAGSTPATSSPQPANDPNYNSNVPNDPAINDKQLYGGGKAVFHAITPRSNFYITAHGGPDNAPGVIYLDGAYVAGNYAGFYNSYNAAGGSGTGVAGPGPINYAGGLGSWLLNTTFFTCNGASIPAGGASVAQSYATAIGSTTSGAGTSNGYTGEIQNAFPVDPLPYIGPDNTQISCDPAFNPANVQAVAAPIITQALIGKGALLPNGHTAFSWIKDHTITTVGNFGQNDPTVLTAVKTAIANSYNSTFHPATAMTRGKVILNPGYVVVRTGLAYMQNPGPPVPGPAAGLVPITIAP